MYEVISFHVRGLVPCIMHNGRLADPLDPITKEMKLLTGLKKKTDDVLAKIADLEVLGGLYVDENNHPCWPGHVIEAMIRSAAKKQRRGNDVLSAVICDGNFPLIYNGPKDAEKVAKDPKFRLRVACVVDRKRIMRSRPMFSQWELKFDVHYEPSVLNEETVIGFMRDAGQYVGLSTWRPKYGRFEIVEVQKLAAAA